MLCTFRNCVVQLDNEPFGKPKPNLLIITINHLTCSTNCCIYPGNWKVIKSFRVVLNWSTTVVIYERVSTAIVEFNNDKFPWIHSRLNVSRPRV